MAQEGGNLVSLKPSMYSQVAQEAWINGDGKIGVRFAQQKWIVEGAAGVASWSEVSSDSVQELFGTYMSLVSIKRLARVLQRAEGALVPLFRYSECRLPISEVREMGRWRKPEVWERDVFSRH